MTLEIAVLPNTGCLLESAISCYTEAFSLPPYSDPNRGREVLTRLQTTHRQIAGFRAFIAVKSTARKQQWDCVTDIKVNLDNGGTKP